LISAKHFGLGTLWKQWFLDSNFTVLSVKALLGHATRVDQNKPFEMTCLIRNSDCGVGGHRGTLPELQQLN